MPTALPLFAAEVNPVDLVQFGVLGVVLALVLAGWLWAKPSVDRLIADKESAEAQRDSLVKVYQDDVIPTLGRAVEVISIANVTQSEKVIPLLAEVKGSIETARAVIEGQALELRSRERESRERDRR